MLSRFLEFMYSALFTRVLWVLTAVVFAIAEAEVVITYAAAPTPHTLLNIARMLVAMIIVSCPGLACLHGHLVVQRLPPTPGIDRSKLVWLGRQFLAASIAAYVAMSWRRW